MCNYAEKLSFYSKIKTKSQKSAKNCIKKTFFIDNLWCSTYVPKCTVIYFLAELSLVTDIENDSVEKWIFPQPSQLTFSN